MLHNDLPRSRLHVHTFSLRSLFQQRDRLHDIDDDEYVLATSPSLYSICVASIYLDSDGNLDYNEDAALRICVHVGTTGGKLSRIAGSNTFAPPTVAELPSKRGRKY
jgi:hypothetical protein